MGLVQANQENRLGSGLVNGNEFGPIKSVFLTYEDFTFSTISDFGTEATWRAGIVAGTVIPVVDVDEVEDMSVEAKMYEAQSGFKKMTMSAIKAYKLKLDYNFDQQAIAKGLEGRKFKLFEADFANHIKGVKDSATIKGFAVKPIYVDTIMGTPETPGQTTIYIQKTDPSEEFKTAMTTPTWSVSELEPVIKVTMTCSTVAANAFTATVKYVSGSKAVGTAYVEAACSGLVAANFYVIDQTGSLETCTVVETAVTGVYTVTGASITAGTAKVIPSTTMIYGSDTVTLVSA